MEVDGVSRGAGGGRRGGRGGSSFKNVMGGPPSRPAAAARSAPYTRVPSAAPADKWTHDLFGDGSDLYSPQINLAAVAALTGRPALPTTSSSSSLRPFGALTPLPFASTSSSSSSSTPSTSALPATTAKPAANTVFSRFGIRGVSNELEREKLERERAQSEQAAKKRREALEHRRKAHALQKRIADAEAEGFVVQVDGLVFGTSAEDVQTAFGAYGDTSFCFVVNEETAREEDDLSARLTFERKKDAEQACQKLNGAIADGKPLKVQLVAGTPQPTLEPPTGPLVTPPVPVGPRDPLANGVPRGPRATQPFKQPARPAAAVAAPPPPAQRTMYADVIESVDPRLSSGAAMDVDMTDAPAVAIPTGPRNGTSGGRGRGGRGGARGAFGGGHQQQQQPPSLLSRFGAAPAPTGPGQKGGSLLARLG